MPKSSERLTAPETVWLAAGRHTGPAPQTALREHLRELKNRERIQDFLEKENDTTPDGHVFEARWFVDDDVTVRARLTTDGRAQVDGERRWTLAAEAERPWDPGWPSPAALLWPERSDLSWDRDAAAGLLLQDVNPLPKDDAALRRLLKDIARHSWSINVVVHEAMTPDAEGRLPLVRLLPPALRHRVVEHRATPEQFHAVNWALGDLGTSVPRGGAVILSGTPARTGFDEQAFRVRSVFLDGSEPTELLDKVVQFAALPWPLPDDAAAAFTALREEWSLLTLEEELTHARALVASYSEALDAMTKSRDLYREATELAHTALSDMAEYRDAASAARGSAQGQDKHPLAKTLQRVTDSLLPRRAQRVDAHLQEARESERRAREASG
uniref:Heparinase II/III-family protein n=1 Tax=Streptomyces sp. NBC_01393 TaxID=2903851 RepID=A0AAU3I7W4_9ACTN